MQRVPGPPAILPLIADSRRWRLLFELARSDRRVGELVELVEMPQNLVSYHLGELRKAGVVTSRRSSADRRDIYYRAELMRCRELIGEAGAALHPGLRLGLASPAGLGPPRSRPRVLFLCTGNSARSQIAEALLEHRSGGTISATSAGSHPKVLHPNAVRVLAERGIDIAGRRAKPVSRFVGRRFDRVITLCDKVREICPDFPGSPIAAHWSISDPAAGGENDGATYPIFEAVADELEVRISFLIDDLGTRPEERRPHA